MTSPRDTADDPLMLAGFVQCRCCQAASYPVAAVWLPDGTILACFEGVHTRACTSRRDFGTIIIRPGATEIPAVDRPRLCLGLAVTTGRQCRSPAQPGSGYCKRHDPTRQAVT
jgi:hypothetical protein